MRSMYHPRDPHTASSPDEGPLTVVWIEDDERLVALTRIHLESHQIAITWAADGQTGIAASLRGPCDCVLLDLMLPRCSGIDVCRELRARTHVPIIILSARDEEADRVLGLELGADDYVSKPFSTRELLARVLANVRRARGRAGPAPRLLTVGELTLDTGTLAARYGGRPIELTPYEFSILRVLAESTGRVIGREQLMFLARGSAEDAFDRSIDVHVSRIRQKLGGDPRNPRLLKTIRGVGYGLVGPCP